MLDGLLYRFIDNQQSIKNIITGFEKDYLLDAGMGLFLFKCLVANRRIILDMDKPIRLNQIGKLLYIPEISEKG